jgi:diguanylate cyclase (GGDEF)-like protein/PAS domain S-box-containing protein
MKEAGAAGADRFSAAGREGKATEPSVEGHFITRLAPIGLAAILLSLAAFAVWAVISSRASASRVAFTSAESDVFDTAHYAVGQEESLERKYRLEPGPEVLASYHAANDTLAGALGRIRDDSDSEDQLLATALLADHARYLEATSRMFAAVDEGQTARVNQIDTAEVDPIFGDIQQRIELSDGTHRAEALGAVHDLNAINGIIFGSTLVLAGAGLALIAVFWVMLRAFQRRRAESVRFEQEVLRRNEARFRALVQNSSDMITVIGADTTVLYQSPASARVLGYEAAELEGARTGRFVHPDDLERVGIFFAEAIKHDDTPLTVEARLRHGDGSWRQAEILVSNRLADEEVSGFVLNIRDITEREQAQQALRQTLADLAVSKAQLEDKSAMLELALVTERERARRDSLTNAFNHGAISEVLRELVSGSQADGLACAVAMVDVDGMKAVNDTYGHQAGDRVLIAVADALGHNGALVGRYGGDEFIVILPGAGRDQAERYRDTVLDDLAHVSLVAPDTQASIPVRVSVGVAVYPEEAQTVAALVALSDSAMYAAKRQRSSSGDDLAGLRPMGDDRAAKMVGELAPLLTSPGDANSKLRLVAHRLSVGAGYDAVDFTLFAPTPGAPLASNAFARIPADVLEAWKRRQATDDSAEPHPLRTYFARSPRPVIIEEFASSELVTPDQSALLAAAGLCSGLVAPLIFEDEVVGMLAVGSKRHGAFTAQDAQFVGNVATQVTAIVRMAQLVDELQGATTRLAGAQAETVMMLAAAAEAHDRETGLHLLSIRTTAEALARELGYADPAVHDLGLAAVLHDIGKISVPDAVLSSAGTLQDDEWALMKRHTLWGAEFLSGKPGFELAASVARSHHERWDGGGYPDGLAGDAIPEAATIVTVADSFDAMTHDRPYKLGRSVEDAIQEIVACSGEQFSPRVVEALLRLQRRGELPHALHGPESDRIAA